MGNYYRNKNTGSITYLIKEPDEKKRNNYELVTEEENTLYRQKLKKKREIEVLKNQLAATDYQVMKYAEGWISAEDYAPIKAQRQSLRDQINALEAQLN